jgi:hypothetical protein
VRATLKRIPMLVTMIRAMRRFPGAAQLRHVYAELFSQRVFANIYRENMWSDAESRSGGGSNLHATAPLRVALPPLLQTLNVRTLLDVPCGDFRWMSTVALDGVTYIGADIVPDLIAANQAQWGAPGRTFLTLDAARDGLPRADLILCRDLLIHLSFARICRVLANLHRSAATWLAVSTYPGTKVNSDARTGWHRPVNLQAAPFHFPPPDHLIRDEPHPTQGDKHLGVWRLDALSIISH